MLAPITHYQDKIVTMISCYFVYSVKWLNHKGEVFTKVKYKPSDIFKLTTLRTSTNKIKRS